MTIDPSRNSAVFTLRELETVQTRLQRAYNDAMSKPDSGDQMLLMRALAEDLGLQIYAGSEQERITCKKK